MSFAYHTGQEVLHDVSLEAVPGQVTAIVGPSGSGKSTIAKLMAGFWDATEGRVSFGGRNVRDIPADQLAEHISYVSQDTFLFDASIAENIRLGRPNATDEEVRAAATAARCDGFISELPQGYETGAGEAGGRLSGGERQRIAIARAILKDAPVIILDEATAYADPENESFVEQALSELVSHKTLIVIAHRLSTVCNADKIVVVEDGRIVGQGTHGDLLANCPTYKGMWESHMQALGLEDLPGTASTTPLYAPADDRTTGDARLHSDETTDEGKLPSGNPATAPESTTSTEGACN